MHPDERMKRLAMGLFVIWAATCADFVKEKGCIETKVDNCIDVKRQPKNMFVTKRFKKRKDAQKWIDTQKKLGKCEASQISGE
jgi:hypothetical protein